MGERQVNLDSWLRSQDPLDPADAEVAADQTERMLNEVRRRIVRDRHRRTIALIAAVAAVTCTAAVYLASRSAKDPTTVACYESVEVDAGVAVAPMGPDPVTSCQQAWDDPAFAEVFRGRPVPPLVGCVSDSATAAVYPADGEDPCIRLGLDRLEGRTSTDAEIQRFEAEVARHMLSGCVPPDEAVQIVRDELERAGLSDWTVVAPPETLPEECGSVAIDAPGRTVHLIPIPSPPPN